MVADDEKIISTDQMPDDPLKMPGPYWRSPGASLQIVDALQILVELFHQLLPVLESSEPELAKYYENYPEYSEDDEWMDEFAEIMYPVWELRI